MGNVKFRIAKPSDAKQIAYCHWHVKDRYSQGIFLSLGECFLRAYYKIILNDPYEVIVCAEREDGKIIGFCSANLDSEKQFNNLKKHKIKLGFAAIGAITSHPHLIKEVWMRYKSLGDNDAPQFVYTEGARGGYWCWLKSESDGSESVDLNQAMKHILFDLGLRELYSEVDKQNKRVYNFFTKVYKDRMTPVEEITLPDGRIRVLLKERLTPERDQI
jgi:hypothetical protein